MINCGTNHPPAILEYEHIVHVFARPKRRRTRRPQLDNLGRPVSAQRWEGRIMVRAVQDNFVTPVGQARPAIRNVHNIIWLRCLKPARAEGARPLRKIRTLLSPWGDNYVGTRQRVDAQISVAHESSPYEAHEEAEEPGCTGSLPGDGPDAGMSTCDRGRVRSSFYFHYVYSETKLLPGRTGDNSGRSR